MKHEQREGREPGTGKRKRRKQPEEKRLGGPLLATIIGSGVLFVVILVVVAVWLFIKFGASSRITAPESFATYETPEAVFRCEYPKGWDLKSSGIKNSYAVTIERRSASINVRESMLGSLVGDIANAGPDQPQSDERSPVARVHAFKKKQMEGEYNKYEEGRTEFIPTKFGKVARSAFTATQPLGPNLRGYRATALGHMTSFEVICQCSASDWETLRPAFERVIASLGPGTGETN